MNIFFTVFAFAFSSLMSYQQKAIVKPTQEQYPKNIILLIGDGMGFCTSRGCNEG